MRLYVASSWRNVHQPHAVAALRGHGHAVYDFRNPEPGNNGFAWSAIDPGWQSWDVEAFREALGSDTARDGFGHDRRALEWCEACVLVLPSGMSAHLEAGWCGGRDKPVCIWAPELREPELMYKLFDSAGDTPLFASIEEVVAHLAAVERADELDVPW